MRLLLDANLLVALVQTRPTGDDNFSRAARRGEAVAVLDHDDGIRSEWRKTSGELADALYTLWFDLNAIVAVKPANSIPRRFRTAVGPKLFFRDTVDKLMVRTAMAAGTTTILSEDSDFWDPSRSDSVGDQTATVATCLRELLDVAVRDATFLNTFAGRAPTRRRKRR